MSLPAIFIISFGVGLSGALMPGPMLTATINEAYREGFIAGPLVVAGHAVLEGTLIVLLFLGLDRVLENDVFFGIVGLAGGAFLLWMGLDMALEARDHRVHLDRERSSPARMGPFAAGITTSLSNPYWFLWWATFGLSYMLHSMERGVAGVIFFFAGHVSADIVWYFSVAFVVAGGRRFLSRRVYEGIILGCGFFLLVLGARFIADGLSRLV
jgi:threonine/homoserine/homoserine lactone efflux protein